MMFLIRTGLMLALVLLILPIDKEEAGISQGPTAFETLAAVRTVVTDVGGFCQRNPETCATGAATAEVLRQKAVYSAGVVQTWLSDGDSSRVLHADMSSNADVEGHTANAAADDVAALIMAADARLPASAHPPL